MAAASPTFAERMAEAATAFATSLSADQRARACHPFESGERERWFYTPTVRAGLPLRLMGPAQAVLAHRLVASGLSAGAYQTASTIIGLENTLDAREGFRGAPQHGWEGESRNRDPLMYFLAIYGEPGAPRWGWQFGGHHVSLNFTIRDGRVVSPTPTFFGADPAESAGVGPNLLRPLAGEEDIARELLHALDPAQRARAIIAKQAPGDLVQSNRSRVEEGAMPLPLTAIFSGPVAGPQGAAMDRMMERLEGGISDAEREAFRYTAAPKGLPAAAMTAGQEQLLRALIGQYIGRLPDDVAALEWEAFERAGLRGLHFAWAGGLERKQPHYYRLQGPRFLVEYDNVQNGANHVHTVWRDPEGDFGRDLLSAHYAASH